MNKALLFTGLLFFAAQASAAPKTRMSLGMDYSSGDYGSKDTTDIWSLSLGARHKTGKLTLKGSLPYLRITGPGSVAGPDGVPIAGATGGRKTEQGIGDLVVSAAYLAYYDKALQQGFSITGKVKVPTADEDKGLGTGKTDVSLQFDPFRVIGKTTLFASLGYKFYGDPSGIDYRDAWYGRAGAMYQSTDQLEIGLSGSLRQKVTATSEVRKSLTLFAVQKLTPQDKVQLYLIRGFSDSTADWGAGAVLMHSY